MDIPAKNIQKTRIMVKTRKFTCLQFMQAHMTRNLPKNFNEYFKEMRTIPLYYKYTTRGSKEQMIFKIT